MRSGTTALFGTFKNAPAFSFSKTQLNIQSVPDSVQVGYTLLIVIQRQRKYT